MYKIIHNIYDLVMTEVYKITPINKKSVYQTENWTNKLSNGKMVTLLITTFFRGGSFEIELSNEEKKNIMINCEDHIILNDYSCSCDELYSGCDRYDEIKNKDMFNTNEMDEIEQLIYSFKNDDGEKETNNYIDEDILELNDWSMDDTEYGIYGGFELNQIS